jgi:serine/threonine protein kinase
MSELFDNIKNNPINWKIIDNLNLSSQFKIFIKKLLNKNSDKRPTITQVEKDPWIIGYYSNKTCCIQTNHKLTPPNKESFQYRNQQEIIKINALRAKNKGNKTEINKEFENNSLNVNSPTKNINIKKEAEKNKSFMCITMDTNYVQDSLIQFLIKTGNVSGNGSNYDSEENVQLNLNTSEKITSSKTLSYNN